MLPNQNSSKPGVQATGSNKRVQIWYALLLFVLAIFIAKLFYIQIIKHDYYHHQALADQLKEYSIPSERGIIEAYSGTQITPMVLNQKLYTLFADPAFVKKPEETASKLASITKADPKQYVKLVTTPNSRYQVLAKKLSDDQNKKILSLQLPGIGTQGHDYRIYPQGSLAAQLLGFVNDEGTGNYGVEQALNDDLAGKPGLLKAITDINGVPLVANRDNVQIDPVAGKNVVLTVDLAMQRQTELILKQGLIHAGSPSGSAIILDANSGAVKAMANWPSYDPSQYSKVSNDQLFNNPSVSSPLEVGSVMKVLTVASALDQGVIKADTTYYNPSKWIIDGHAVTNVEENRGEGTRSIAELLNLSLNTGATWVLMQMGGGQINHKARNTWHDYMVNHYQLGKPTGIEQGYESAGSIPDPDKGYALDLTYANTAFGQAMTATPLQMAAALASVVNGGTYYQPHLVDRLIDPSGKLEINNPKVVRQNAVSAKASADIRSLMEYMIKRHFEGGFSYLKFSSNYIVGGKTGTAQIASPDGGYLANKFNGTYYGFVGGDKPQYVIFVRANAPSIGGYAGSVAAQPLFASLAHMLIDNFNVAPKS